jgi:hypothetical protein
VQGVVLSVTLRRATFDKRFKTPVKKFQIKVKKYDTLVGRLNSYFSFSYLKLEFKKIS